MERENITTQIFTLTENFKNVKNHEGSPMDSPPQSLETKKAESVSLKTLAVSWPRIVQMCQRSEPGPEDGNPKSTRPIVKLSTLLAKSLPDAV